MNTVFKNLLKAIGLICYFIVLSFAYTRMNVDRLTNDIKVFAGVFLLAGLIMLERAYKKDDGKIAISGIELLFIAMHSLSINHVINFYKYDFKTYLLTSSYIFAIYYVLKSIISYTKEKRAYLKNLSDISEIVKEEPIKKEAKRRRKTKSNKIKEETSKKAKEKVEERVQEKVKEDDDEKKKTKSSKTTKNKEKKESIKNKKEVNNND